MKLRAYNDPDYRAACSWLKRNPDTLCHHGCGRHATTIDHVPALMHHTHQRGADCCQLKPACRHCNCSTGAADGNRQREPHSGWM